MIRISELCKSYDEITALDNVTFSVQAGEVIGLLGPNGAGKTTLMKIITGFLQPDSGSATVDGLDVLEHCNEIQGLIGYLPENAPLYPELTVQSYLRMVADLRRIPHTQQPKRLSEAIYSVGLQDRLVRPIGTLSKGYRQRVGLAQAILHRPRLLILDEPTNGLDPTQIMEVRHLIRKLAQHSTVMVSTHILSEVEATCDRAIIIINGQVKADATLADLATSSSARLLMETANPADVHHHLATLSGVQDVRFWEEGNRRVSFQIKTDSGLDICPAVFQLAKTQEWQLCELHQEARTLESVFNELASAGGVQ